MQNNFLEHIFVFTSHEEYPASAVALAQQFSRGYEKPLCFVSFLDKKIKASKSEIEAIHRQWLNELAPQCELPPASHILDSRVDFQAFMERAEASIVIFQLSENAGYNKVMPLLKMCRELRVPYIFSKPYFEPAELQKILVPVSFLVEDREKGVFANSLGRWFGAELLLMPAKDYGTKARQNTHAICSLLDKYNLSYKFIEAMKDSFKVELEAIRRTGELGADLTLISASREYGLDDIVFGPKELACINEASVPVMLINPRADLYVLCG
ncbi:MAG: hypothetical protein LBR81_07610 [Prevotellaceae bacterium]|jgi:hypothetical protein|nr:hypothetical protein [Prevotellaceae bacterium]